MSDRDRSAISTWERDDDPMPSVNQGPSGHLYICRTCRWQGKAAKAAEHHHEHPAHAIRGKDWPASWPNCQWSQPRDWRDDETERARFEAQAEREGWTQVQPDLLRAEVEK